LYPYITLGSFHLGTFGLFLWLAAVLAGIVLHLSFQRDGVDADALAIVTAVVIAGVLGAKTWHELQSPSELVAAMRQIALPGLSHPGQVITGFFEWMRAGIAWFGGLVAGIVMLVYEGYKARPNGLKGYRAGVRMLDLAAAAAPIGYGIGRIGCMTSGDGDYGRITTSAFWGVHLKPTALVPIYPANALVLPTPFWECAAALIIAFLIWKLGNRARPLGFLTGVYLVLSGLERFTVEFWRINPKLYLGMSNAQVAAVCTVIAGSIVLFSVRNSPLLGGDTRMPANVAPATPSMSGH
jgi:phosphatidylglycerol:prolipoprotein diacylglycerol transferase